ncbi:MAG: iron-sulfur cluster repair di-iron protein [Anaerolineae bacterium]|nr:iron-sulfur cluster repair di-iron protein [Anaerolineae bacterium]
MSQIQPDDSVASVVVRHPALWSVLEDAGIDYCCGGSNSLAQACRSQRMDVAELIQRLEAAAAAPTGQPVLDPGAFTLTELADHIEQTHHAYLRAELPRLGEVAARVVRAHGSKDARLQQVQETLGQLALELEAHMAKEERILFPIIRQMEAGPHAPAGAINGPIRQMELEHQQAGDGLDNLRRLSDGFALPEWACNTYRALMTGLQQLENDLHQHIHKENNILFPRALQLAQAHTGSV